MKFNKTVVAMLLAVVMVASLATAAMAEDAIRIGVIGPFTGGAAIYGNACKYGAEVAAAEINAQGGVQVQLFEEDDEHNAEKSVNAYYSVLDNKAQMIAGTTTTIPCIEVGKVANQERVFMLTPSASSVDVIDGRDNVFQVCFTDPAQGSASAEYIASHNLATKIAVIYNVADPYSVGIYTTFMEKADELSLDVVVKQTFNNETTDFSAQVNAAKDSGADLVFLPIYYDAASSILQFADSVDYKPVFFGVDGMDGILTLENFDVSLAEGVMLLTPFSADAQDERTVNFVKAYQELTGEIPNQFAADCYDAVYALYTASMNAGITGETSAEEACELLIAEFTKEDFVIDGITGTMSWDASGAVTKTPTAVIIENGTYVGFEG